MKTAKELKEYALLRNHQSPEEYTFTDAGMKCFERQLCREQRHECQIEHNKRSVYHKGMWYVACTDVRKAKQPET